MRKPIRILISTNDGSLVKVWQQVLSAAFPEIEYGEAENSRAAVQAVLSKIWDVLLLDIDELGCGGLDMLKEANPARQRIPAIILTRLPEDGFAACAFRLGACGYVQKEIAGNELVKAVESISRGCLYITEWMAERLSTPMADKKKGLPSNAELLRHAVRNGLIDLD
jgi:DNA-binding NarL/FixJ family response regulator